MSGYSHLTAEERDRIAGLKADGLSLGAIARALGRAASTISREIGRNALESGAYRPHVADGAYMLRRQRKATIETDAKLAAYVTDRLTEGWTPEQVAGRLRLGIEPGLRAVCTETIYDWIYRAGQKADRPWRFLTRRHARRRKRHGRASKDKIAEKTHISQRSDDADARATVGHWERQPAGLDDHHFRRDRRADLGRRRTATTTAGDLAAAGGVPRPLSLRRWRALFQIGRFLA